MAWPRFLWTPAETELLIDLAEEFLATPSGATRAGMPWADLGTGSGALAVGLARSPLFKGRVVAVDVSPEAMRFTRYNAARLGVSETVEARLGKWWAPLEEDASLVGRLGGLLSNPPYIPAARLVRS